MGFFFKPKNNVLQHIGTRRHSGRYPWGSGNDQKQRSNDFLGYVDSLKKEGLSELEIATGLGMKTTELRNKKSILKAEKRAADSAMARRLKDKGLSNIAIGKRMGINESSVRALLDPLLQSRSDVTVSTANMLRNAVEKKGYIDVGLGVESGIGISRTKLNTALALLKDDGYKVMYVQTQQLGTGKFTSIKVLAAPGTVYTDLYKHKDQIKTLTDATVDGGLTYKPAAPIQHVPSSRVGIRYYENGGKDKDGVIELRRGVSDISLGNVKYAQVRIGVDGTHFLKGMAMYSDDIPKGVDIVYNTSKHKGTPKEKVFKEVVKDIHGKVDPEDPFGTVIMPNGRRGALNIVNEEGSWGKWSKSISSQILSKQSPALAKNQLGLVVGLKKEEFDEISSLTNPGVKRILLQSFADGCDAASVHLKAAALPRQATYAILPLTTIKPTEVYAPKFKDGEQVVLIRHPHGGIFEIPELRVNNKNPEANKVMQNALDAIGIHPIVASKLSGADFDGDAVLVIPNKNRDIKSSPSIKALLNFETKEAYPPFDGMSTIDGGVYNAKTGKVDYGFKDNGAPKKSNKAPKQLKMGDISNLITDMTIKGANDDEIARAVKHSMVVIDSEKHSLNYKQSAIDNGIAALKKKYQGGERSGASTLISRASSELRVPERKDQYRINTKTGDKVYQNTGATYTTKSGKVLGRTTSITKMEKEKDANALSSGTRIESVYASHANDLKALANKARLSMVNVESTPYSPSARITYAKEVESLKANLAIAYRNKPRERQAQLLADKIFKAKYDANPDMEAGDIKKIKGQALEEARARTGAKKHLVPISDREWEAIQLGAISTNTLSQILQNTDKDALKERAMPRTKRIMSTSKILRAKTMLDSGYTQAEVAEALGVSTNTLEVAIK